MRASLSGYVVVAQWLGHLSSKQRVASSSLVYRTNGPTGAVLVGTPRSGPNKGLGASSFEWTDPSSTGQHYVGDT